jgi:hypothetical protein
MGMTTFRLMSTPDNCATFHGTNLCDKITVPTQTTLQLTSNLSRFFVFNQIYYICKYIYIYVYVDVYVYAILDVQIDYFTY